MNLCSLFLLTAVPLAAATYFVDCTAGSDAASGTSSETAWKSTAKVSATTFTPGDSILFLRGTRCAGALWPKGSGDEARPVRIGAYGKGPLPVIEAAGADAAIKLFDQHHWEIESLEASGGDPYGIYVGGASGDLRHFKLKNLVVHDVTGTVKTKDSGLVAVLASGSASISDIVIDGITAYGTTQWAGIIVRGGSGERRARNVTVRNSIVHDVYGDGIVLLLVEDGLIANSAAWRTGLQPVESIGTPNGIWTWSCRNCTVRHTEGFYIDSPGVDGGVYDIDWGNNDNVVEHNYGHDAMGYCAAVFGAGKLVTSNSIIRHNVCIDNGRSPKLALRQGDLYISTWEGGALDGVRIHGNYFRWTAPIDAPVVQMDHAEFTGSRPNIFENNIIDSAVPSMIHSSRELKFERNRYSYSGRGVAKWSYGAREFKGFEDYNAAVGKAAAERFEQVQPPVNAGAPRPAPALNVVAKRNGRWLLLLEADTNLEEVRRQVVFIQTALAQYGDKRLDAAAVLPEALRYDWNLGDITVVGSGAARPPQQRLYLISPAGNVVTSWEGFVPPADLGLAVRREVGAR